MLCIHNVRDKKPGVPKGLRKRGLDSGKVAELLSSLSYCLPATDPALFLLDSKSLAPSQHTAIPERETEEEQTVLLSSAASSHHLPHFSSLPPRLIYSPHCSRFKRVP